MTQQEPAIIADAMRSEVEKVSEIQFLSARAQELSQGVDWWNTAMIWALVFAAIAAIAVVFTTRIALVRAKQLADIQDKLIHIKDGRLSLDLKLKDEKIAEAGERAAEADKNAGEANKAAADAKTAQQRVETDLAKQQERAAKAEKDLVELKERIKHRRLTDKQSADFV
jgi:hypothetical protein